jgi:hypothetical protein
MPPHQRGKGLFGTLIPPIDEPIQQLAVADVRGDSEAEDCPQISECFPRRAARHALISLA